jgi:hypothetical protein
VNARRRGVAAAALAVALLSGCATSIVAGGRLREGPYQDLVARVAHVRGLSFDGAVAARVVPASEVAAIARSAALADLSPDDFAAYQEALATLGLWPDERAIADVVADVAAEEAAGLYVARDRTLYVVRDASVPFSARLAGWLVRRDLVGEMVLSHELVHALQHQAYPGYFDRDRFLHGQDDLTSALEAALEGDATYHGFLALGDESVLPDPEELARGLAHDTETRRRGALADAPGWIRLTLGFPYAAGYALALREGRRLLDAPPASTEQALHADRRREAFGAIDLAPAHPLLPAACALVHENGLGELGIRVLLRELAPGGDAAANRRVAEEAAEGWDGDRYLVARCEGRRELLWTLQADDEAQASQLEAALRAASGEMAARGGLAAPPAVRRDGRRLLVVSAGLGPVADRVDAGARRARVSTLADAFAFFGEPPPTVGTTAIARSAPR